MKIMLEINDIDYAALVEQFLPVVRDRLAAKDNMGSKLLSKIAGMSPKMAVKMVKMLPQESKDELAIQLVRKNRESIMETITEYAKSKGLSFTIERFMVK